MNSRELIFLVAGIVALGAVVLALLLYRKKQRTEKLRRRFGPEYERTVIEFRDDKKAEAELERREKRVRTFHLRTLSPQDQDRFSTAWRQVQAEFVDDPPVAINRADQ